MSACASVFLFFSIVFYYLRDEYKRFSHSKQFWYLGAYIKHFFFCLLQEHYTGTAFQRSQRLQSIGQYVSGLGNNKNKEIKQVDVLWRAFAMQSVGPIHHVYELALYNYRPNALIHWVCDEFRNCNHRLILYKTTPQLLSWMYAFAVITQLWVGTN